MLSLLLIWSLFLDTHPTSETSRNQPGEPVTASTPSLERVRSDNPVIAAAIRNAPAGSATLRRLLERISVTDGLIYVDEGQCGHSVRACLVLTITVAGPHRVLRILVNTRKAGDHLAEAIGHELQHALEVLSEPAITSSHQVFHFFLRVGPTGSERFETEEAVKVGMNIGAELRAYKALRSMRALMPADFSRP